MYGAGVIYCPHFSLNPYLKFLMRDLRKLGHWGCLSTNYKVPIALSFSLLTTNGVLQDTT